MDLDQFIFNKTIFIDDAGWGDLILGVVIGALKIPNHKYMVRKIPVSYFQSPKFENKEYLDYSIKIAKEIIEVMQPDQETCFNVCSGYVLSSIREFLKKRGFVVKKVEITGELQEKVERSYKRWCREVGVPEEKLFGKKRFWTFLEWIRQNPKTRETLVKTGWKSWNTKWREYVFET
jgi:hypothetical protein